MPFAGEFIQVAFQWAGTHRWPDAKGRHVYLQHTHRHLFKGTATIEVFHGDRELEFLAVQDFINDLLPGYSNLGAKSCEWVATNIINHLTKAYGDDRDIEVRISEDGENGAIVKWSGAAAVQDAPVR